jgi:hypothetical protein
MDNKILRGVLIGALVIVVLLGSFSGGFLVGHFLPFPPSKNPPHRIS